jgi:hypothetical protein
LLKQRVAVCLSLHPVTGRVLAVTGRLLAIGRRTGSTLGRRHALSRCAPTILRPHHDLHAVTHRSIVALQLAIVQLGGLIAHHRRQIARVRNPITSIGRLNTPLGTVLALLGAAIANFTRSVVHIRVATVRKVSIAGCLIAIGSSLVSAGRGLVALRPHQISIRESLIAVSERLIVLKRLRNRSDGWYWVASHCRFLALAAKFLVSLSAGSGLDINELATAKPDRLLATRVGSGAVSWRRAGVGFAWRSRAVRRYDRTPGCVSQVTRPESFGEQGRQPESDRGCHFEQLQRDPVGEGVAGTDSVCGEDGDAGGLEHANVSRCDRDDRGNVGRDQHGRCRAQARARRDPERAE